MVYHYIKKGGANKGFVDVLNPVSSTGSTYNDYLNGMYVELTEEQYQFHNENPTASPKEVFELELAVPVVFEKTYEQKLKEAKDEVLALITEYDLGSEVNSFFYKGQQLWIDKATRVGLVNAANAEMALGNENITVGIDGLSVTLPCANLLQLLYALESYALKCYNNTLAHKKAVIALADVNAVSAYNYTTGYPEKLNIE